MASKRKKQENWKQIKGWMVGMYVYLLSNGRGFNKGGILDSKHTYLTTRIRNKYKMNIRFKVEGSLEKTILLTWFCLADEIGNDIWVVSMLCAFNIFDL